ncbi:MAG: hypothetical protein IPM37_06285 [Hahellaceae bacterium]|nr:hypothetical protein [Hahellaceae bacterium]
MLRAPLTAFARALLFAVSLLVSSPSVQAAGYVTISLPQGQKVLTGERIPLWVEALDSRGVHHVSLYVDGKWVAEDRVPPYEFELPPQKSGAHNLRISSLNGDGRWRHATETLTVATSRALDARIQYPGEGSVSSASEPLTVEGFVRSSQPLSHVSLYVDNQWKAQLNRAPYQFRLDSLPAGQHRLSLRAKNQQGQWARHDITIAREATPEVLRTFDNNPAAGPLYDWSRAGYRHGSYWENKSQPRYDATQWGARPNDGKDDLAALQKAINAVGDRGGGILELGIGTYDFNTSALAWNSLKLNRSGVVLRGKGSNAKGTVFRLHRRKPGTSYDNYLIDAGQSPVLKYTQPLSTNLKRGATLIPLKSPQTMRVGDWVILQLSNPVVNGQTTDTLSKALIAPLTPEPEWINFKREGYIAHYSEVTAVYSNAIRLADPLPREVPTTFKPQLSVVSAPIREIGVEHIFFTSNYPADKYQHHLSWEHDYGWRALRFWGVRDSWIHDIGLERYNGLIMVKEAYNVTVKDIVSSTPGHLGVSFIGTQHSLADGLHLFEPVIHAASASSRSSCNVIRNVINYSDALSGMDAHGAGPSSNNLFENIYGLTLAPGGNVTNMPHTGQENTWWNIENGPYHDIEGEFFTYGLYAYSNYKGPYREEDLFRLFPRAVFVGIFDDDQTIRLAGSDQNRHSAWFRAEHINRGHVQPLSLYAHQKQRATLR